MPAKLRSTGVFQGEDAERQERRANHRDQQAGAAPCEVGEPQKAIA